MEHEDSIEGVICSLSKGDKPAPSSSGSGDDVPLKQTKYESEPQYLSKEDLEALDQDEPKWRRFRIALLIVFGVVWLALVIAVILIVVLSTKCPPRPELAFWQSGVAYYVDLFAFKDSGGDGVGDIGGLLETIPYIKETVGAKFIILAPISLGYFTNNKSLLGLVNDHTQIDPALGTVSDFRQLLKRLHKTGMQLVVSLDFNGIADNHVWMRNISFLKRFDNQKGWSSRYDRQPSITNNLQEYYSVDNKLIDLDLTNEDVVQEILRVVQYWLDEDVDGILLKNCAFYVEDDNTSRTTSSKKWSTDYPAQQLFQIRSVDVVRRVRKHIDDFSSARGKKCVLIADPGDTGYGLPISEAPGLMFLGSASEPAAHLVMHPEFTEQRGWKFLSSSPPTEFSVQAYSDSAGTAKESLALFTASDVYRRHSALLPTVASIIFPGTPVIYYGSELGVEWYRSNDPPKNLYPAGKLPTMYDDARSNVLSCHLPMPWDRAGTDFSANSNVSQYFGPYLDQFKISDTVESLNADGRGRTLWTLIQKLVHLRSKIESLQWGSFTLHEKDTEVHTNRIEIVQRKAEGFQPVFGVFYNPALDPSETRTGIVIDFSWVCEKVWLHVAYPNDELKEDKHLESLSMYIKLGSEPAFYLFQCE
ncbi:Neutral and basic amino acid transport protein rBAT [Clonorchis sinensis]|uniref:Neutral and basic amino acid transport protein rBAT n=1 Tax=Clonorchis sinensis TaxID=79923 RepID=A0A419PNS1_CLOSI|nr:Neutral and basic amino acid transport protein rBAT [Clonorchis sinensis]